VDGGTQRRGWNWKLEGLGEQFLGRIQSSEEAVADTICGRKVTRGVEMRGGVCERPLEKRATHRHGSSWDF